MSIFWIGGPKGIIVPAEEIKFNPDEDRYFMPGAIHGSEDYIIQSYYWSNGEGSENDRIGIKYLYADSIVGWSKEAVDEHGVLDEDVFAELINDNAEEFVVENDGTGDFVSLNEAWSKAFALSYRDIISWAHTQIDKTRPPFVAEISLLDPQMIEKVKHVVPSIDANFWIKPPGYNAGMAAYLSSDGRINLCGPQKPDIGVRPIVALSGQHFNAGDKVNLFNHSWTVFSKDKGCCYALCDNIVANRYFDKKSNDYEKSGIKLFLGKWLGQNLKDFSYHSALNNEKKVSLDNQIQSASIRAEASPSASGQDKTPPRDVGLDH